MSNCDPVQLFFDMLVQSNATKSSAADLFEWFKEWIDAEHGVGERGLPRLNPFAQCLSKYCKKEFGPGVKKKVRGHPFYCVQVQWVGDFRPRGWILTSCLSRDFSVNEGFVFITNRSSSRTRNECTSHLRSPWLGSGPARPSG